MILHLLHSPYLVWWVLLAVLTTMVSSSPSGWRSWTVLVCWIIVIIELFILKGAVSWR